MRKSPSKVNKCVISFKVCKDIDVHLARINSRLEDQAKNQQLIDGMRTESENRLRNELSSTRTTMADELAKVRSSLDEKVDALRTAQFESMLLRSTRSPNESLLAASANNNNNYNEATFYPRIPTPITASDSFVSPTKDDESDGFSHLLHRQLERTIQHHINAGEVGICPPPPGFHHLKPISLAVLFRRRCYVGLARS